MMKPIHNFALIIIPVSTFGGAQRRFTNLFKDIYKKYPNNAYYFVSYDLLEKIKSIYPDYPLKNLIPIGPKVFYYENRNTQTTTKTAYNHSGAMISVSFVRKIYRWIKSLRGMFILYREIERNRKAYNIKVFMGVYTGIIPLYFYLMKKNRHASVLFCDMDSWFSDVLPKEKKYWYRKYSSFNYALENSDHIDFLSPFILKGVKERGIKIKEDSISITPCSFTDYSKCKVGNKNIFRIAFAGRLEKDKNPDLFLESAIILSKKYPEIIFHIMGDGRLSSYIQSQISNHQLNNIIFHGFHPQPTEILADTSVFVSIQTTNNYPSQSVLEAMGCGNAVIASDVGDTRMFVNEDNGILINLDAVELANAVEKLYLDRELCSRLGQFAFKYVRENHSVEKMADYYVTLFNNAYNKIINT